MIKLYSTETCPKCNILKMKMDKANLNYEVCMNIEEMTKKGIQSVPFLEVDGQLLDFGSANKWIQNFN
jgi:Glutaredoxin and related proteins